MIETPTARELHKKIRAGYPIIFLTSHEYLRVLMETKVAATGFPGFVRPLFVWAFDVGLLQDGTTTAKILGATKDPDGLSKFLADPNNGLPDKAVIALTHYHHFLGVPAIQARLMTAIPSLKKKGQIVVITAPPGAKIPPELNKEFTYVEARLPSKELLAEIFDRAVAGIKWPAGKAETVTPELREACIENLTGLSANAAENALAESVVTGALENGLRINPQTIMRIKCETLKAEGMLEYVDVSKFSQDLLGGLDEFKDFIKPLRHCFSDEAKTFGCEPPRGMCMIGIPGTGKSYSARASAKELGIPLLRADLSRIFAGTVGSSEANARNIIQTAEAMAPVLVHLDEIEKGFAGANAGALDSGVGARVVGIFLTAMQESQAPVYWFGTANDIDALPPELLRKGRFDELFFVDLPNTIERRAILDIHIRKRGRGELIDSCKLDLSALVEKTHGFSGAEIEEGVKTAMRRAFYIRKENPKSKADLNQLDLQDAYEKTAPLSQTAKEKVAKLREWCSTRARPANRQETEYSSTRQVDA